jgi:hypothetical protein
MVDDDNGVGLDGVEVVFDDERVVSDAGIVMVATLAERLGIERLASRLVRLRRDRPGAANPGRKVMALIYAVLLGADSIDDCAVLRAGRTGRLLGGWIPAPSNTTGAPWLRGLNAEQRCVVRRACGPRRTGRPGRRWDAASRRR